ncbi:MAG: hypothetical protein ABFS12_11045 [Bacteroidota bacterium]
MEKDLKLTELRESDLEHSLLLDKAYVMDPPPFVLRYLDELVIREMFKVKYNTLAKVAELKSQIIKEEAIMFNELSDILSKNVR